MPQPAHIRLDQLGVAYKPLLAAVARRNREIERLLLFHLQQQVRRADLFARLRAQLRVAQEWEASHALAHALQPLLVVDLAGAHAQQAAQHLWARALVAAHLNLLNHALGDLHSQRARLVQRIVRHPRERIAPLPIPRLQRFDGCAQLLVGGGGSYQRVQRRADLFGRGDRYALQLHGTNRRLRRDAPQPHHQHEKPYDPHASIMAHAL
jgi:hypothetical protein